MTKSEIVRNAIKDFPDLPNRTIARYILFNYGDLFDNDLEKIRDSVRYHVGAKGEHNRQNIKELLPKDPNIKIPTTWRKIRTPYNLSPGLWLILADVHFPFHEPQALEAAVKYGQNQKIKGTLINGDLQDCASISFWKSAIKRDFDKEVVLVINGLDWLRQELPGELVYKPGNHEYFLPRLFQSKVPELMGLPLAAMDTILGLESRGIEFLDYYQVVKAGKLPILHGHELGRIDRSVNPARGLFLKAKSWAMCGHCHTTSEHSTRNIKGELLTTWSIGCLSDLSPDFNPYAYDWNHGFALVNVEKNGGFVVENRRILPNGNVV